MFGSYGSFFKTLYRKFSTEERALYIPSHEDFEIGFQAVGKQHKARVWIPKAMHDVIDMHSILHASRLKLQADAAPDDIDVVVRRAETRTVVEFEPDLSALTYPLSFFFMQDPPKGLLKNPVIEPKFGEFFEKRQLPEPGSRYSSPFGDVPHDYLNRRMSELLQEFTKEPFIGHEVSLRHDRAVHTQEMLAPNVNLILEAYREKGLHSMNGNRYDDAALLALYLFEVRSDARMTYVDRHQLAVVSVVVKKFRLNPQLQCCSDTICSTRYALEVLRTFIGDEDVPPEEVPTDPTESGPEPVRNLEPEAEFA